MGAEGSKAHWQKDEDCHNCKKCNASFSVKNRRHHCRNCGYVFCGRCTSQTKVIPMRQEDAAVRVCDECYHSLCANDPVGKPGSPAAASSAGGGGKHNGGGGVEGKNNKVGGGGGGGSGGAGGGVRGGGGDVDVNGKGSRASPANGGDGSRASSEPTIGASNSQTATSDAMLSGGGGGGGAAGVYGGGGAGGPDGAQSASNANRAHKNSVGGDNAYNSSSTNAGNTMYYDPHGQQQQQQQQQQQLFGAEGLGGDMKSIEEMERDRIVACWSNIRANALFADVLVQRVERVDVNTMMEYSNETSNVTLSPEVPQETIGAAIGFPQSEFIGDASGAVVACLLAPLHDDARMRYVAELRKESAVYVGAQLVHSIHEIAGPSRVIAI